MEIIDNFSDHLGNLIFRVFRSSAAARQNLIRQHRHTEFEISLILSGSGLYRTENGDYDIRSGDIFLYSANEYFSALCRKFEISQKQATFRSVLFNNSLLFVLLDFLPPFSFPTDINILFNG